jgi:ankyrin repeat protein
MKTASICKGLQISVLLLISLSIARADDAATDTAPTDNPDEVALAKAADKGNLDDVKKLVFQGVDIDSNTGSYGETPLGNAADNDHLDVLQFLLDKGARPDFADHEGSTPLLHACNTDHTDCALALINAGANVNLASNWRRTPLMYATQKGNDTIVKALLDHKADIDANCSGGPAVFWAISNDKLSTLKILVEAGANLTLVPEGDDTRMHVYTLMATAAETGDPKLIDYLIDKGQSPESADANGQTALMVAVNWQNPKSINELLAKGAKIDAKDSKGRTALMQASFWGNLNMVKLLLDKGADINATDNQGETALTIAGDRGEMWVVDVLAKKNPERTDIHIIAKDPPAQPLSTAQSWALAVALPYPQINGEDPHVLGFNSTADVVAQLKLDWGVHDKDSLVKTLDTLRDLGQHTGFQAEGARLAAMADADFDSLVTAHPDKADHLKALRASYVKWKDKSGLAWDICRSANLVNMGYDANYITEDEAWARLLEIARTAQSNFTSWQELSDNFLDGREIWANKRSPDFEACAKLLLDPTEQNSPWNQLPWQTDLASQ